MSRKSPRNYVYLDGNLKPMSGRMSYESALEERDRTGRFIGTVHREEPL